jgi:hypothetical protein
MQLGVADLRLQVDEEVLLRAVAADARSDWRHGFSSGEFYLTDRRLILHRWSPRAGPDAVPWELPIASVDRVSSVPVPVWLCGLVRVWLPGIRLVTADGGATTLIMGRSRATECINGIDSMLRARRRSADRTTATLST